MNAQTNKIIGLLILVFALIWLGVFSYSTNLELIGCSVGQGDAFLIQKGTTQVLIDAGPGDKVIDCLSSEMPFWDRKIEVAILTHPQKDHYGGFLKVFEEYEVGYFLATAIDSSNEDYQVLKNMMGGGGTKVVNPKVGQKMKLGLIYLEILHPLTKTIKDQNVENVLGAVKTDEDPNIFSVVVKLSYQDFDALFTGDIGPKEIDTIISENNLSDMEYLKVPHHGSKNGLTKNLLEIIKPKIAVIGVGKNQWGHPHKEILDMLSEFNAQVLRTDEAINPAVVTTGQKWWIK